MIWRRSEDISLIRSCCFRNRIAGHVLAEDVVDPTTGEVLAEAGTQVTRELADTIQNAAVPYVMIQTEERDVKVLSSMMVDLRAYVDCDPQELGITELVYYPVLEKILEENESIEDIKDAIPQIRTRSDSEAHYEGRYHCFHQLQYASGVRHR